MKAKITKRLIESIGPAEKDEFVWDVDLIGFGVKITPKGKRVYLCQYRQGGRVRRYTLGAHGPLTPDQARQEAARVLGEVAGGHDPASVRAEEKKSLTLEALAERYMSEHALIRKKPRSVEEDQRLLKNVILPALARRKVADLGRIDILRLHQSLREKPTQANRTVALLSKMMSLAEKWGLRPDGSNPCRHVEKFKETKRERFLSGEELARLGQVLAQVEAEGQETPFAVLAIRLLLFTGARLGEVLGLKWAYVDLERGVLRLPDSKTGAKVIPLTGPAIEALLSAPRMEGNDHVIPGLKAGSHFRNIQHAWQRIRARAGLDDVRIHDLRHSFASVAAAAGLGLPLIGALLGHTQAQTTKRYAHLALDPLKTAAEEVAKRIDAAMKAEPEKKVLTFRKKP